MSGWANSVSTNGCSKYLDLYKPGSPSRNIAIGNLLATHVKYTNLLTFFLIKFFFFVNILGITRLFFAKPVIGITCIRAFHIEILGIAYSNFPQLFLTIKRTQTRLHSYVIIVSINIIFSNPSRHIRHVTQLNVDYVR